MSEIGIYFAKMLLAKQRAESASQVKKQAMTKRALAEIGVSLLDNVEALNSFPGVERKIIDLEPSSVGFILRGYESGRNIFITVQNEKLQLGNLDESGMRQSRAEKDDEDDDSDDGTEWYDLRWSELGIVFTADIGEKWVNLSVNNIVIRAFGMVINGAASPLLVEGE
jgi:hypothetical protein